MVEAEILKLIKQEIVILSLHTVGKEILKLLNGRSRDIETFIEQRWRFKKNNNFRQQRQGYWKLHKGGGGGGGERERERERERGGGGGEGLKPPHNRGRCLETST